MFDAVCFTFIQSLSEEWKQLKQIISIEQEQLNRVLDWDNQITGKCLYWEIAQVYGQSAHQLGRDALVQAVVPAEVLHPDEDPPDTRGPSVRLVSTGTAVCAGHKRASVSRAFAQPRLDRARNVVFQQSARGV